MEWQYRWIDEAGIAQVSSTAKVKAVDAMSLKSNKDLAGKTLTLYVYDTDVDGQILYDINTGITVSVKKRALKTATAGTTKKQYNGFAQTNDTNITVVDEKGVKVTDTSAYEVTSTSATKVGEKIKTTVTAKSDSAYTGSAEVETGEIIERNYVAGDILAGTTKDQSYQYTGSAIKVSKDKVTLKESASSDNGADKKLSGADLSDAITTAQVEYTKVGDFPVVVYVDKTKLKNFTGEPEYYVTNETVTIAKRDLSTAGTKISVGI